MLIFLNNCHCEKGFIFKLNNSNKIVESNLIYIYFFFSNLYKFCSCVNLGAILTVRVTSSLDVLTA